MMDLAALRGIPRLCSPPQMLAESPFLFRGDYTHTVAIAVSHDMSTITVAATVPVAVICTEPVMQEPPIQRLKFRSLVLVQWCHASSSCEIWHTADACVSMSRNPVHACTCLC